MKKKRFTIAAFAMAVIFWNLESFVHYFVFDEPRFEFIPNDFNEQWMRTIIFLLIMLFGIYADSFVNNITKSIAFKEKQLEVARIYNGMIEACLGVVSNLLNQMELFRLEALKTRDFDRDIIALYDNAIKDASDLIDTLSRLEKATEHNTGRFVDPFRKSKSSDT